MHPNSHEFFTISRSALADAGVQETLSRSLTGFQAKRTRAFQCFPEGELHRQRARSIKQEAMAHLDVYLDRLAGQVEANGGVVHWAPDGEAACEVVLGLCERYQVRSVVKSKSMTTEEIELNPALERRNIEVTETDLGEYIIQLAGERPSHILAPAFHKTRADVARLFSRVLGETIAPEFGDITAFARRSLRQKFLQADMGISGVNFAVAESGTLVLITNEGNARFVTSYPRVHVAIMGMEKVIPTQEDLAVFLRLVPRSASGQHMPSYVTMVGGPRRGLELEGPDALHLIILDNGRSRLLASEVRDALHCVRCGACLNFCPVYGKVGGHAYGWVYSGPIGSIVSPMLHTLPLFKELPFASSLCGACREVCPVMIDIPALLLKLRSRLTELKQGPPSEAWAMRLWSWTMVSPARYRLFTRLAAALLRGRGANGFRGRMPFAFSRWTASRDFPAPAAKPFWKLWRERLRKQARAGSADA